MKITTYWKIALATCILTFEYTSATGGDHASPGHIPNPGQNATIGSEPQPEHREPLEQIDSLSTKIRERESAENAARQRLIELIDSTQEVVLLEFLNCGTKRDLESIAGVASVRAEALIAERPFHNLSQVAKVRGIGLRTFVKIVKHLESLEGGGTVTLDRSEVEALVCK